MIACLAGCSYEGHQAGMAGVGVAAIALSALAAHAFSAVDPSSLRWTASGGWEISSRTDTASGNGPVLGISHGDERDSFLVSVALLTDPASADEETTRLFLGFQGFPERRGLTWTLGPAWHASESGEWGVGVSAGLGVAAVGERLRAMLVPQVYLWLGKDDADDFAAGALAGVQATVGLSF